MNWKAFFVALGAAVAFLTFAVGLAALMSALDKAFFMGAGPIALVALLVLGVATAAGISCEEGDGS